MRNPVLRPLPFGRPVYRAKMDYGHRSSRRGSTRSVLQVPKPPSAERVPSERAACSAVFHMSGIWRRRNVNLLTAVRRDLGYRDRNHFSFTREIEPKQTPDIIKTRNALIIGGYVMHSLPAEWLPVSVAPSDGDVEVCALDYDGIVHALVFPCRKDGAQWVDASNREHVDIQPTHWRKWTESH